MAVFPSEYEHSVQSVAELAAILHSLGADKALLKVLPKNANDKNQIYFSSSFSSLYNNFDLTLAERGVSTSLTKTKSAPGSYIPEAVFNTFSWVRRDQTLVRARNVKVIVYTQYPEARLSGFQTVQNNMPQSLSVSHMKENPECTRLLVLGRLPGGACVGLVCLDLSPELLREVISLPGLESSRVCKVLSIEQGASHALFKRLAALVSRPMKGCRLDIFGNTLKFTGTQVCGYTLEHALGIVPNAARNGDIDGIELKTHTQVKVTLFTPEPDFGLYTESFEAFMRRYGYVSGSDLRLTGVHRANVRCAKSGLTLKMREWRQDESGEMVAHPYDPSTSLTSKMGLVEVVLEDDEGFVAAGWSLERLMNNWGVKHNEVVYLSASKTDNLNEEEVAQGYAYQVTFAPRVMWCRGTSAEHLLRAISEGVIFLDPAPKFVPGEPSKNKRRAQWRVNDITKAVFLLYENVKAYNLI